ncbi:hypothetical protein MKEN_01361500 [Mycena kentingensis (nom. inval.)]|nr:hypothetical protein MKEN_01361500 [Mycena kentingensis (nom. inval.)]
MNASAGYAVAAGDAAATAAAAAAFDPAKTLGGLEVGVLLAYMLFGVTSTQAYRYFTSYPNDSLKLKLWVTLVWLCEAAHVATVGQNLYVVTIVYWGHPERLGEVSVAMLVSILFTGIIAALVQSFFAVRIYNLFRTKPRHRVVGTFLLVLILLIAAAQPTFSIVPFIGSPSIITIEQQLSWVVYTVLGLSAVNDLLITSAIVWHLAGERGHAQTRTVVVLDKLIQWTIETGLVTSAAAILALVLFTTSPLSFGWLAVEVVIAKLYSNSLLASLNSRTTLRALRQTAADTSGARSRTRTYPLQVNVATDVEISKGGLGSEMEMFSPTESIPYSKNQG